MLPEIPFLTSIGKIFVPKRARSGLKTYVAKAGYQDVPYSLFGVIFFVIVLLFYMIFVVAILPAFKGQGVAVAGAIYFLAAAGILILLAAMAMLVVHFYFNILIYERTKELEAVLPDYLTMVSTNLKGGMSFESALWEAIKPEFGILANEIGLVSKRVMTGNDIKEALEEFMYKYDSLLLRRNFQLVVSEFESGGEIVKVIDKIIESLKKTQILKKEMVASTVTYMIFIGSLVTVICPALFALSYQLFFLITSFMGSISASATSLSGSLQVSAPAIKPADFRAFSILAIIVISFGSSAIISIIEKGDARGALKYIPVFTIAALIVYFLTSAVLTGVFSSITALI